MNTDPLDRLERLFRAAQMHPPEERAAFLDAACADDPALRAELESLLAAEADEAFLAPLPALWEEALQAAAATDTLEGEWIGPYRVLRPLGHGGMGDVYLGMREEPFRRYVALKVIRRGTDSREVVARFVVERQILASLDHPGIARLIDGGLTDEGLPYFAMEYVEGQPITTYCNERRLSLHERLQLFVAVCEAVHYAHQNLVLHRDLKPSNILVIPASAGTGSPGQVKLLDFGIAKLLNPQLSHLPIPVTRAEGRMLTPEYASPEQVRGEPLTTASDVYSLGVLLYELLTGRQPHRLAGRSTQEIIQIVSEEEPVHPSTAVTQPVAQTGAEEAAAASVTPSSIARARNLSPDRLRRRLRGDLDAITLMALRKEPNRRYGSAELLAQDIERHLSRQPVLARRGNRRYRLGKFLRRHRVEALAVAAVLVALLGGLGAAIWQAAEARRERDRAAAAQVQAEEVAQFLEGLFAASDPYAPVPERLDTLRVREFLARGAAQVRTGLSDQPLVQAQMLDVVGRVYRSLGLYQEAKPLLEQALRTRREAYGARHPDVAESLVSTALLLRDVGENERAQDLLEEALAINIRTWGREHPIVAVNLNHLATALRERGLYEEAEQHHLEALQMLRQTAGDRDPRLALFMNDLVATLEREGDYDAAEHYARESVALHRTLYGEAPPQLAVALRELGLILQRKGNYREAESLFRESLGIAEATLGEEHPRVADLLNRLASVRWWLKDLAAADSIHRKSLALKRRIYGDVHLEVAYGLNNLASVLRDKGAFAAADSMHREALEITRATVGEEHAEYWIVLSNLATTRWAQGDCRQAEPLLRTSIAGMRRTIPRDHLRVPLQQRFLGDCLRALGRYAEAETELLESYAVLRERRGADDDFAREAATLLATLYADWDKPEQADHYRALIASEPVLREGSK